MNKLTGKQIREMYPYRKGMTVKEGLQNILFALFTEPAKNRRVK